jgi:DNA repair exonuclease SbcCD ATPase subunit
MSNDYSSDPPVATAGQLLAISDKINDLGKSMDKLAELPQKLDRMNMQLEQVNKEHQQTRNDLSQTRDNLQDDLDRAKSNFKSEIKQVRNEIDPKFKEMDMQIRVLHESKTKIDSVTNLVRWGGIAIIGVFAAAWNNQTAKTDTVNAQAMANSQKIQVLEKQSDQLLRTVEEIRNKLYERNYMSDQK